jgi:hypothetical protein
MSGNLANGLTHFIAVSRWPGQNAVWAWIDGGPTANAFALPNMESAIFYNLLTAGGLTHNGTPNLFTGTLAHVWYAKRGTLPDWTNVWTAGNGSPETTAQRFNRLCRLLGIDGLVLGDSSVQIGAQATSGQPPIEVLREVADVEGGLIYAAREDGRLVFETRASRTTQAVSVILLGTIREDALRWSDDDQYLVNDVTHSREGGAEQRVTDEASIAEYGRYAVKETLPWGNDSDALEAAQRRVQAGADPRPRITSVRVVANAIPEHADMLGLDISGVMQVNDLPPGSPANAAAVLVEGYAETITFNHHEITFNTSPLAFGIGWWLGVPGASELGVTTRIT